MLTPAKVVKAPATRGRSFIIGDVHGMLDSLTVLLDALRVTDEDLLIFVGDLVDRGPQSKGVVSLLMERESRGGPQVVLTGNHEEMLLRAHTETTDSQGVFGLIWARHGGVRTLASYGGSVPPDHLAYLFGLADVVEGIGRHEITAAHAWVGSAASYHTETVRWARPWRSNGDRGGRMAVIGHTIVPAPTWHGDHLLIDTGAFLGSGGALTALDADTLEVTSVSAGAVSKDVVRRPEVTPKG